MENQGFVKSFSVETIQLLSTLRVGKQRRFFSENALQNCGLENVQPLTKLWSFSCVVFMYVAIKGRNTRVVNCRCYLLRNVLQFQSGIDRAARLPESKPSRLAVSRRRKAKRFSLSHTLQTMDAFLSGRWIFHE